MLNVHRFFIVAAIAASPLVASSLEAQRGAGTGNPPARGGQPQGYALDYQEQDLRVVLNALAEAGNLNVSMTNIPQQRVSLRMATPFSRDTLVSIIRALAEANGVRVTEQGGLIRLEGDPNASPAARQQAQQTATQQQLAAQNAAANQLRLYTYRLKHASAITIAPVLMSLIGAGTQTLPGGVTIGPGGGIQFNVPQQPAAPGRGGRGGDAGGVDIVSINPPGGITGNITVTPQRGGGGRAAAAVEQAIAGFGGGRGGGAVAQALLGALQQQQQGIGTLSGASGQIRIVAEESTNSLLIRASQTDYALLQGIIATIDLRPLQVLIEVTIAEVSRSHDLNLGLGGTATQRRTTAANSPRDTLAILPGNVSARDFILQLTGGGGSVSYMAALNALQSRGDVKILSLPVIIAQNNKEAMLNVGEQRPFVQVNQQVTTGAIPTTVQTVTYLSVGTALTITPIINPDGYVNMAISQTDNSATNEVQFNAPVLAQREARTQIFLRDGQTTVIGGLAGNSHSKTVSGVPLLSRIPFIGGLFFGNTQRETAQKELFLFLTPHIISSDEDIDRLRNSLQQGSELLKDMKLGPRIVPIDSIPPRRPDSAATKLDSAPRKRPPTDGPRGTR